MKTGSYRVKKMNSASARRMKRPRLSSKFGLRHLESLGLDKLPGLKNLTAEAMISSIDAAMSHEGLPLSRENKQMMRACIAGKISIQDAKAAMIARHSRTGSARNI